MNKQKTIPNEKKYYTTVYFNVMKVVRYLRDGQYFNYIFGGSQSTKDKDPPIPARKRADTWPKSSNESKKDSRMVRLKGNREKHGKFGSNATCHSIYFETLSRIFISF